jgi:hypothetical protein
MFPKKSRAKEEDGKTGDIKVKKSKKLSTPNFAQNVAGYFVDVVVIVNVAKVSRFSESVECMHSTELLRWLAKAM